MTITDVIEEVIESKDIKKYLIENIDDINIYSRRSIIIGSRATLERKAEILEALAVDQDENNLYADYAKRARNALSELELKKGEVFLCTGISKGFSEGFEKGIPCASIEKVRKYIRKRVENIDFRYETVWFWVEKLVPNSKGGFDCTYVFTLFPSGDIVFFEKQNDDSDEDFYRDDFHRSNDLNIPVPFERGDIVTVDLRPFYPRVRHVMIEGIGDNRDCCSVGYCYVTDKGKIEESNPFKHANSFFLMDDDHSILISALYRAEVYHGELPEEERALLYHTPEDEW